LSGRFLKFALMWTLIASGLAGAQHTAIDGMSLITEDRIKDDPGWWPTKGAPPRSAFVGGAVCKNCHRSIAQTQETTAMYHAGVRLTTSDLLKAQLPLTHQEAGFATSINGASQGVVYTVNNGVSTAASTAAWAFGAGKNGQTFILEKESAFAEGRLSYFNGLGILDVTPGQSPDPPDGVESALGRKMQLPDAQHCFSCHTTASTASNIFEPEKAVPGVTCEACHGPGAAHVAEMNSDNGTQGSGNILNPGALSASDSVDFCGACHRTWADASFTLPENMGSVKIRFQPYRLERSRCWGKGNDARLTCVACHDPHKPLVSTLSSYDSKCLACHAVTAASKRKMTSKLICKVGTNNCASCHMPKYELSQTHARFTDHEIRIVHAGQQQQ
jgi:hypothetical protein